MCAPPHAVEAPDWSQISRDIFCPQCRYNLRGLRNPRCPECGRYFAWSLVLAPPPPAQFKLFEHNLDASIESFYRTALATLVSSRFWSAHGRELPLSVGRLLIYAFVVFGLTLLPLELIGLARVPAALHMWWCRPVGEFATPWSCYAPNYGPDTREPYLFVVTIGRVLDGTSSFDLLIANSTVTVAEWTLGTFLALLVFQRSMHQCAITPAHVARCVIYSADVAIWPAILLSFALLIVLVSDPGAPNDGLCYIAAAGVLLLWPVAVYRLILAYRLYLRFDHPIATVLGSQAIVAVGAVVVFDFTRNWV